ncbi:MAG: H/ACA RNA-protein complex protein Gar1 [Crenarchaeota archaeon]|nr:H/ACA RNA-protein complex protein Gar1 [Thermoproteota archaeon]
MRKIGEALHVSHDKKLVLKLSTLPPLYITVYDYSMRRLGVLYDIIGPVRQPFGLVKPDKTVIENPESIKGRPVYVRVLDLERTRTRRQRRR